MTFEKGTAARRGLIGAAAGFIIMFIFIMFSGGFKGGYRMGFCHISARKRQGRLPEDFQYDVRQKRQRVCRKLFA